MSRDVLWIGWLAGLEQVISPESVRQALSMTGRCSQRSCRLTHEVTLWVVLAMEGLWRYIPKDSLLLEDRGFFSYRQWKRALLENVAVLARVKSGLILKSICDLTDGSYLAKIYPTPNERRRDR